MLHLKLVNEHWFIMQSLPRLIDLARIGLSYQAWEAGILKSQDEARNAGTIPNYFDDKDTD